MDNIKRVDFMAVTAAADFTKSLHQTGFAVLYNHLIKKIEIENLYQQWQKFFLENEQQKEIFAAKPNSQVGWIPVCVSEVAKDSTVRDIKEFFNYFPWGVCLENLKQITQSLFQQLQQIGSTLLNWVQQHTPADISQHFSKPLSDMIASSPLNLFRINYYPALNGKEEKGAVHAAQHTDIDLLTVLTAGTTSGLQALTQDGQWHDIPCEYGNLVVNIDDMLQECSQKYYPSTVHHVLNPTADTVLSEYYTAATYLHQRLVEIGLIKE